MNTTEMNLAIAEIKGLNVFVSNSRVFTRIKQGFTGVEIDYLSPELNHGLVKELVEDNWEPFFWSSDKSYQWTDRKIHPSEQTPIVNKGYELNNCLAYIEAFK